MKLTLELLQSTKSEAVRSKCIFLITTCVSNNNAALNSFKELNGFPVLTAAFKTSQLPSQRKIVHLLHRMAATNPTVKDIINEYGIFVDLAALLDIDDLDLREKVRNGFAVTRD